MKTYTLDEFLAKQVAAFLSENYTDLLESAGELDISEEEVDAFISALDADQ